MTGLFRHRAMCRLLPAIAIGCMLALPARSATGAATAEFKLGTAAVKITPPQGTPMAGYYHLRESTGVLDDLYAKAAVMDDGRTRTVMVVCDLIGLPRGVVVEARRLIAEKTGIPADNVMISATHTHTAPVIVGESSRDEAATGGSPLSKDYAAQLPKWIAQAVEEAHGRTTPAHAAYAREIEAKLSFVRRFWMKDGTVGWNPGIGKPNTLRPIGNIDPQVSVVYFETPDKRPLLTYVNFALHLDTTGGTLISADYPATLARLLADYKGPGMLTIFANGACGNVNHINVNWAAKQSGPAAAKRIGTILAADVLKAYMDLQGVEDPTLRARREVVELQPAPFSDEELRRAEEIAALRDPKIPFLDRVKAYRVLDCAARQGKPFDVDVQVFTLGRDIAWVALPGELFAELGTSIKTASPFPHTIVVELANGRSHYIPHRSAFSEGQYEVVSSRYAEGAGESLVAVSIRLLEILHKEALRKP